VQGKTDDAAQKLIEDAKRLNGAGASLIVVECVPRALGAELSRTSAVPIIGIGAGPECPGQVLVIYDALGMYTTKPARFVRNFMPGSDGIEAAIAKYVTAVRDGSFPGPEHCF